MKRLARMARGGSLPQLVQDRPLSTEIIAPQEIMAAGADLPLSAPESTVPAPMQRRLRQSTRKGGLSQCAIGQEGGKENVDPAPIPNLPRLRNTKKRGWPKFVRDQDLGYGAFLTFEIVDDRRLVVSIHRRSTLAHADSPQKRVVEDCREPDEGMNNIPCLSSRPGLPELLSNSRPHFQKTLRKTHTKKCASSRMDVPAAYWRTEGLEAFDGIWYTLNGPLEPWTVKTATNTYSKQTFCSFTSGWAEFCATNILKVGDLLQFTKVGPFEFDVMKVDLDGAKSMLLE